MTDIRKEVSVLEFRLENGNWMRIHPLAPYTYRIRIQPSRSFKEPAFIQQGVVRPPEQRCEFAVKRYAHRIAVQCTQSSMEIDTRDGGFSLVGACGRSPLQTEVSPRFTSPSGSSISFSLQEGDNLYGLASLHDKHLQLRGNIIETGPSPSSPSHVVPYVMSSGGWAILTASILRQRFDLGHTDTGQLEISSDTSELDLYLFIGAGFGELLDRYTELVGKPALLPIWAYGLSFMVNPNTIARDVVNDALKFRESNVPCDLIALHSGWSAEADDETQKHHWHPDRFPASANTLNQSLSFIDTLQRHGFKVGLPLHLNQDSIKPIVDSDQSLGAQVRRLTADGVSSFRIIEEKPSRTKTGASKAPTDNGLEHSIEDSSAYSVVLSGQLYNSFHRHTGQRPFLVHTPLDCTGIQTFAASSFEPFDHTMVALTPMLSYSLCGQANFAVPMNISSSEGIHAGFLQSWAQVNKWPSLWHPCLLGEPLRELFQMYAKLRYRLMPYLYAAAHTAARTGMPIMRAMPLMYPGDQNCADCSSQYMLGDDLLVAVHTHRVYLPQGIWIDYWTGEAYDGEQTCEYTVPERAGGPLFIRAGAILPYWPAMDYIDPTKTTSLELHFFPHGHSEFTLYEDDGITHLYKEGAMSTTVIRCDVHRDGRICIEIGPRVGSYKGMPVIRSYSIFIRADSKPEEVRVDGVPIPERNKQRAQQRSASLSADSTGWQYIRREQSVRLQIEESQSGDAVRIEVYCPEWAQPDPESLLPSASSPLSTLPHPQPAAPLHLLAAVQAAMIQGNMSLVESALDVWWANITEQSALPRTWRMQLLRAAMMAVRHAERHEGTIEDVFGQELDSLFALRSIVSPAQGRELLLRMFRHSIEQASNRAGPFLHPLVRDTMAITTRDLSRRFTLHEIAEKLGVDPSYLSRLFSQTGQSYTKYALQVRMERAKQLLQDGMKVHEAASLTGYKDTAHFSRNFSKYWGQPPIRFK